MRARVIQGLFSGGRSVVQPQAAVTTTQRQGGRTGVAVDPSVLRTTGPGSALPEALRVQMEQALGAGFADVRIHVGPQAQSIGAVAFTAGSDLYFAPGRYQPETAEGRRLLGHELAHVVQQRQGRVRGGAGAVTVVQDAVLEAEADRAGVRAAAVIGTVQAKPADAGRPAPGDLMLPPMAAAIQPYRGRNTDQPNKYRSRDIIMDRRANRLEAAAARRRGFEELDVYVRQVLGPWATQARVSQLIADDFDALGKSKAVPGSATTVDFGKYVTATSTPVLGHARFGYVPPSRIKGRKLGDDDHNRVIYRGFVEQEFFGGNKGGGGPAVRLYVTVAAEAKITMDGTSDYKDVQQPGGAVKIYTGAQANPILWVNAGQPLRAIKWYEKYKVQDPTYRPLIRSFLVPGKVYQALSKGAGLEAEAGQPGNRGRSFNVDRHYATDQFGVRGADLRKLAAAAIPNSLITYTDNAAHVTARTAGRIESVGSLRTRLGVPQETVPGIWVDPAKGDFADKKVFGRKADELMDVYAIWTGQAIFLSDKMKAIPRARQLQLMRTALAELGKVIPLEFWEQIQRGTVPAEIARRL